MNMGPRANHRIYLTGLTLAISGFCLLLAVLPYKHYSVFGGPRRGESILSLLEPVFASPFNPWDILFDVSFLPIFSPLLIFAEVEIPGRHTPGRTFFFSQGLLLLFSAAWMLYIMNLRILESDVKLLPTFYGVLIWVMVPVALSFALISRRIQDGLRRFIA